MSEWWRERETLTLNEAALAAGVQSRTVYRWIKEGRLSAERDHSRAAAPYVITPADLEAALGAKS